MLNDGRLSKAQAFRQIMASCGAQATDDLIAELVRRDQELLLANARLYDDVIPFLTGVDQLADELVLSCEVRSAKPAPEIFRHALGRLGVGPEAAVFVDDQARFC